jgi:uncharacterized protein (TIGR02996 family)
MDLAPFEAAAPPAVKEFIRQATAGEGAAGAWLNNPVYSEVRDELLRDSTTEVAGWLLGMTMFVDEHRWLRWHADTASPPTRRCALHAFIAGCSAGLPTLPRQWADMATLAEPVEPLPESLLPLVLEAVTSKRSRDRNAAIALAQRLGDPARRLIEAAHARETKKLPLKLLANAMALLGPAQVLPPTDSTGDLLSRLLVAWPDCRDPALSEAIVRVGRVVGMRREALTAPSQGELQRKWLSVARRLDPGDVHRLFGTPWPGSWRPAQERVTALTAFPLDPRIARGLLDAAMRYLSLGSQPLHAEIGAALMEIADPGIKESVEVAAHTRTQEQQPYLAVLERIAQIRTAAAPAELLDEASLVGVSSDPLAELWAACWQDPSDMPSRLVLADALQRSGDPRGEFIMLQFRVAQGLADAKVKRRIRELLGAHIDDWTGPLPGVIRSSCSFEMGFLTQVRLAPTNDIRPHLAVNEWRTLQRLYIKASPLSLPLLAQQMPCLNLLNTPFVDLDMLGELSGTGPFPSIQVLGTVTELPREPLAALPNLHTLAVRAAGSWEGPLERERNIDEWLAFASSAKLPRLVVLGINLKQLEPWLKAARAHPSPPVLCLTLGADYDDELQREPAWRVQLHGQSAEIGWCAGTGDFNARVAIRLVLRVRLAGYTEVTVHTPARSKYAKQELSLIKSKVPKSVSFSGVAFDLHAWTPPSSADTP